MALLLTIVCLTLTIVILCVYRSAHEIPEGHVGVYFRNGALITGITDPGLHFMIPLVTKMLPVQTTIQTDSVNDIPCGTSGGVVITFDKVEVVNRLRKQYVHGTVQNYTVHYDQTWIFDKIHHEINQEVYITQFDTLDEHLQKALQEGCSYWAPGIEIISVRVTKPRVPEAIRINFERIENEKTKLQIAMEEQRVAEKRADTKKREATIEAQTAFDVALIEMQKQVANREAKAKMEKIEDDIHLHREHSRAEANFYHKMQESKANEWLLTDKYLHLKSIQAHANNAKVYFGEKIPTMLFEKGSEHIAGVASSDIHASEGNLSECVVNEETGSCTPN